jgi:D-lyxose ketol-isomerase
MQLRFFEFGPYHVFADERWLESLDMKIAVLINRDGIDPRDYGGKSYDEYGLTYLVYHKPLITF